MPALASAQGPVGGCSAAARPGGHRRCIPRPCFDPQAKTGVQFQVPYLVDPNTGVALFESIEIIEYLEAVYTVD